MSGYVICGLDPALFQGLYGLTEAELAERKIFRRTADSVPGFPCRVTLQDADVGDTLLLLNWEHLPVASPYRSSHAIFVREGATEAAEYRSEVPLLLRRRLISLRAFDAADMMIAAEVLDGEQLADAITDGLGNPAVAYLHAYNAKRGCFAARIDRA